MLALLAVALFSSSLFNLDFHTSNSLVMFFVNCHRSRTLKDLNDVQLSKIIDSMEEVCAEMSHYKLWIHS